MIGKTVAIIGAMIVLMPTIAVAISSIVKEIGEGEWGNAAYYGVIVIGAIITGIGLAIIHAGG